MVISILETNEIDVLVACPCGVRFYMYITDAQYQCTCGKLYSAHIHILEHTEKHNNWILTATPIADPHDNAGGEDEE